MNDVQAKHVRYHRKPARFLESEDFENLYLYKSKVKNLPGDRHFETPRANFIKNFLNYKNKIVLDIGCTTGFFVFDALDNGAGKVICYEGAADAYEALLGYIEASPEEIEHHNSYFDFQIDEIPPSDIVHLLNVVHHFGDDYGADVDIDKAKLMMIKNIDAFAEKTDYMVFQMGYNWKGNIKYPLFKHGEKREVVDFLQKNLKKWSIENIGIPVVIDGFVEYFDANDFNMARDNALGEFLNRPLFILKSKCNV